MIVALPVPPDVDSVNHPVPPLTAADHAHDARAMLGSNLYLRPEIRARVYDAGDNTIDVTASIALGFSVE